MGRTFLLRIHRLDSRYLCKVTHILFLSFYCIFWTLFISLSAFVCHIALGIILHYFPFSLLLSFALPLRSGQRASLCPTAILPAQSTFECRVWFDREIRYIEEGHRETGRQNSWESAMARGEKKAVRKWRDCMKFDMSNDRCADARDGIWTKGFIDLLHSDLF